MLACFSCDVRSLQFLLCLVFGLSFAFHAVAQETNLQPISEADAARIVEAEERAKEAAKDAKEAKLKSEHALKTTVLYQGDTKIVFNEVRSKKKPTTNRKSVKESRVAPLSSDNGFIPPDKPLVNFTLSGEVNDEGISEVWWQSDGEFFRIYTNANFKHLSGIGTYEGADSRYSVFMLVTSSGSRPLSEEWYPKLDDFTEGEFEYFIVEGSDNPEAFKGIETMVQHYAENEKELRTKYENAEKLRKARKEYLRLNPPKKRDTILNYSKD